jgi:hypothetical protein
MIRSRKLREVRGLRYRNYINNLVNDCTFGLIFQSIMVKHAFLNGNISIDGDSEVNLPIFLVSRATIF